MVAGNTEQIARIFCLICFKSNIYLQKLAIKMSSLTGYRTHK